MSKNYKKTNIKSTVNDKKHIDPAIHDSNKTSKAEICCNINWRGLLSPTENIELEMYLLKSKH